MCIRDSTSGVPIKDILLQLFPATLELSLAALVISTVLGSILGILSALKKGSIGDNALTVLGMIGVSIPQFFFGMLCILVFALDWAILPIGGRMAPGESGIWAHFKYLILPASVLGISLTAGVMRYLSLIHICIALIGARKGVLRVQVLRVQDQATQHTAGGGASPVVELTVQDHPAANAGTVGQTDICLLYTSRCV